MLSTEHLVNFNLLTRTFTYAARKALGMKLRQFNELHIHSCL